MLPGAVLTLEGVLPRPLTRKVSAPVPPAHQTRVLPTALPAAAAGSERRASPVCSDKPARRPCPSCLPPVRREGQWAGPQAQGLEGISVNCLTLSGKQKQIRYFSPPEQCLCHPGSRFDTRSERAMPTVLAAPGPHQQMPGPCGALSNQCQHMP